MREKDNKITSLVIISPSLGQVLEVEGAMFVLELRFESRAPPPCLLDKGNHVEVLDGIKPVGHHDPI